MPAPLSPITLEIIVLLLGVFLLLAESFSKGQDKTWMARFSIFILGVTFAWSFFTKGDAGAELINAFYSADASALFYKRIALLSTIFVLVMSLEYLPTLRQFIPGSFNGAGQGEFLALPVFTCAGLMFMASAIDLLLVFVSLELVTISFYILVAYMRRQSTSLEAGVKYLILGALSTGFLVYGITWIFGVTGETNLVRIAEMLPSQLSPGGRIAGSEVGLLFGLCLFIVACGFKVAAAPFQFWVPDVYQGAPTPITAFLSVGSKAAGFIVLMRVLEPFLGQPSIAAKLLPVLAILAAASLIYGNLAAMVQDNFKRLLAYSSIGHAGYLLVALACMAPTGSSLGHSDVAVSFYLAGYMLMTLLSFTILIVVSRDSKGDEISHFNGLSKRSPFLAFSMLVAMMSLAGVPLTVGFYGKFLVFASAVNAQQFLLIGISLITVAAGFYYYLRVVRAMYWKESADETPIQVSILTKVSIATLVFGVIYLGIFPQAILTMLSSGR
jgi:NADH-quinone oxidoreductase subunit N